MCLKTFFVKGKTRLSSKSVPVLKYIQREHLNTSHE